jgi:hypothetical protein
VAAGAGARLRPVTETRVLPEDDVEEVDALPVVADRFAASPASSRAAGLITRTPAQVVVQAAAVALTSFAAGAVVTAVARRARAGKPAPRRRAEGPGGVEVLSTRTFLVDVHLLGGRD